MKYEPNANNGGRWHHIASEAEIMRAMRTGRPVVYEIPMYCITILVIKNRLTIVRCGGTLGGDTRDIECGWVYLNEIALGMDEREIAGLTGNPMNEAFGG